MREIVNDVKLFIQRHDSDAVHTFGECFGHFGYGRAAIPI